MTAATPLAVQTSPRKPKASGKRSVPPAERLRYPPRVLHDCHPRRGGVAARPPERLGGRPERGPPEQAPRLAGLTGRAGPCGLRGRRRPPPQERCEPLRRTEERLLDTEHP